MALSRTARTNKTGADDALRELLALAEYDRNLRALLLQRTGAERDELDVIFGRPVVTLAQSVGLVLERKGTGSYAVRRVTAQTGGTPLRF